MPEIAYPSPPDAQKLNNQNTFTAFVQQTVNQYRSDEGIGGSRERDFLVAMKYLKDLQPVLYGNGFRCHDDKMNYIVIYRTNESLYIEQKITEEYQIGYVRQLQTIVKELCGAAITSNPEICDKDKRKHKIYGLELELMTLYNTPKRYEFLASLNGLRQDQLDTGSNDYGVDGSNRPLELRNINGNSPNDVCTNLDNRLKKFFITLDAMKLAHEPITTTNCGIHVHYFHKGVNRGRVLAAHSIVGMMVNSFNWQEWQERANHGYGVPFAHRVVAGDNRQWCGDQAYATELRMFNVFHPKVLEYALEKTNVLVADHIQSLERQMHRYSEINQMESMRYLWKKQNFNKMLHFLISNRLLKLERIVEMQTWLSGNYRDVIGCRSASNGLFDNKIINVENIGIMQDVKDLITPDPNILSHPNLVDQEPREMPRFRLPTNSVLRHSDAGISEDIQYNSWCERVSRAQRSRPHAYRVETSRARYSLGRHIAGCAACGRIINEMLGLGERLEILELEEAGTLRFVRVAIPGGIPPPQAQQPVVIDEENI